MRTMIEQARIGDHVFLEDGGEEIGAVRMVRTSELVVYVEGAGDFVVDEGAVRAVHYGKVVLDAERLDPKVMAAANAAHAHEINESTEPIELAEASSEDLVT